MIVFATTTDITNPGREFGYSDKLTQQLREVGDMPQTQDSRLTFGAGIGFLGFDVFFLTHFNRSHSRVFQTSEKVPEIGVCGGCPPRTPLFPGLLSLEKNTLISFSRGSQSNRGMINYTD